MVASVVAVVGHVLTFFIAAHAAGVHAGPSVLVPLALLALVVMAVPLNIGGFGPREGVAAWAFGAAGLTAGLGVTTAVLYGALVLVASLPGAARAADPPAAPAAVDRPARRRRTVRVADGTTSGRAALLATPESGRRPATGCRWSEPHTVRTPGDRAARVPDGTPPPPASSPPPASPATSTPRCGPGDSTRYRCRWPDRTTS